MANRFAEMVERESATQNRFSNLTEAPAAQPEKPGFVGALTRGFKRTLPETTSVLTGTGAVVAGAVGADGVRDKLLRTYQDIQQNEVAPLANQSGFIDAVTGNGSLSEWAGDTLGNFAGQAVQSLAAAAAGAIVGSAVPVAGTVAGGVGGLVVRTAAKDMVERAVANMVAKGVAKDAAEKLVLRRMGGAALATTGLNTAQEVGIGFTERAQDAQAAGEELTRADALRAIAYGIPAGLLDTATEAFTAGKLMRGASSSPNRLTRMAAGAATGAVTEGGTEGAQAVLERAGAAQALTGTEAYKDYIENVAAGALGGSVPGAVGGIRTPDAPDAIAQPPAASSTTPATPPAAIVPPAAPPTGPLTRAAATLAGATPATTSTPAPGDVATPPEPVPDAAPAIQPAEAQSAPSAEPGFEPTDLYKLAMDAAVKRGITSINGLQKELDIPREQARSLINALETNNVLSKPDERKRRRLLIDPTTGALIDEAATKADRKQARKQADLELRIAAGLAPPRPDPAAGPVLAAAASAVDTGAADIVQMQQAAQQIEAQQPTAADQQRAQREQLQQAKMERQAQALDAQTYGEDDLRALMEADLDAGKTIDAARMMRLAKQAGVKPRAVDTLRRTILAERASGSRPALTDQPIDAEFTDVSGQDTTTPALPAPTVDPKAAARLFPFPTEESARASAEKLTQRKGVPYTAVPHPREPGKWVAAPQPKAPLALPAPAPAPAAEQAPVEGKPIDAKWTAFAPESGTLGVPRAQMPQIRAEHRGALVNYLNARGIGHDSEQVPADTLKPTQAEFAPAKVHKAASGSTDRSILVSQDGHVLDGHHQWMAARNAGLPVNIIRLQAPIQDLLQAAKEFPSSTVAAGAATGAATAPDTTTKEQSNAADGQEGQQGQGRRREGRREALLSPGATVKQSLTVAREKALKRIERGTAFFGTRAKADEFIANAGLGDSHEAVQVKAGRFDVRAKQAAAVDVSTKPQNANTTAEGKPADAASAKVRQLADAEQRPGVKRSLNALADAMAAKDEKTVSAWVAENPDNTTLRKAFEDATGVKLPRTIKGGREAVSAWAAGKVDAAPQQAAKAPKTTARPALGARVYNPDGSYYNLPKEAPVATGRKPVTPQGLSVEDAQSILATATKVLEASGIRIQVITSAQLAEDTGNADENARRQKIALQAGTKPARAAVTKDRKWVYFFADRIASREQLVRTAAHELVGHIAIEQLLGGRWAELRTAILKQRESDKWKAVFDEVTARYTKNPDGTERSIDSDTLAAEVIAVFAERNIQSNILQAAMVAARGWLRRTFPAIEIAMDPAELRQLLWEAGRKLEGKRYRAAVVEDVLGGGQSNDAPAAETVEAAVKVAGVDPRQQATAGAQADAPSAMVRQLADAEQRPSQAAPAPASSPEPAWWAQLTGAERHFRLKAAGFGNRTASTPWNRLSADEQRAMNEQWGPKQPPVDVAPQQVQDDQQSSEPRDDQRQEPTEPSVRSGNQEGVSGAQGRRERDAQPRNAPPDTGDVAAAQPENVAEPAADQSGSTAGVRTPAADVAGEQDAQGSGNASTGRKRAGGKKSPDAGAGGAGGDARPSVTAPETVSPANPGPGNFHIANPLEVVGGGQVARFNKNKAAIELFIALRDEGRRPTRDEQEVLAGYTGWGSFGQELFQGNWSYPQPKQGWEQRDQWLREHLGREDWEGLQRSITNAHYTDPPTVMAMWDMVRRLGFKGGRVLEPGMGIGNFFGMMPLDLKERSKLAGIELDPVTGGMAQMLYPDAAIKVMGYQDSKTPDDFYDLVIGNWPFENTPVADRRYNRLNPMLHDYFFLKTLDQVRPGGIVIGITSAGSMDKKGTVVRRELAKKAQLVAAFRLPSGAFEEYAGTKVVTDIIVLRKRAEPLSNVDGEVWVDTVEMDTPAGEKVRVNAYYKKNPQNVVGTIDYGHGTTTFRPGMIVHRPDDMQAQLNRIVAMVPEGAYLPTTRADSISYIANHTSDREGALTRTDAGLFIVRGEHLAPAQEVLKYQVKSQKETAVREAQLDALIDMRKAYGQLIEAERGTSGAAPDPIRARLREQYDAFVKAHGPLSESYGLGYLERIDDPFYYALAALETKDGAAYRPAAILSQSTIRSKKRITSPSIRDAFVLARNGNVNPSLEEIAAIAKQPADKVRTELVESGAVFETPGGDIVPSDMYLSGNVREKLRQAKVALADGNAGMQRNVAALEKVQPADIPYFNIEVQMGATWVPTRAYEQFVAHMLNRSSTDGIEASYTMGRWKVTIDPSLQRTTEAQTGFGTRYYKFGKLVNAAISNQTVVIKGRDSDGREFLDQTATDEANAKIADMREKFGDWLWSDAERRIEVEREYNEVRNAYASPSFDGSFLNFEGMALNVGRGPFDLRQHQVNAIWRALVMRRSLNAHEVGTGKTFTMGGIAIESRRYGIAKKPVLLAHNANSKSVASEIQMMYPAAKVLYIDNLSPKTIDVRMRQIANDDWDLIVLPHSLIERLSFREETLMAMAREEIEALEEEARSAAADDGVRLTDAMLEDPDELKKLRSPTAKELVKARARIIETIKKQAQQSSREGAVPFEDLGIDMVLVDEAHEFKKPPIATRMKMKGLQTQSSLGSIQLNFLTRYVREQNNGGNVHLFTGTPITNTLTEIYHQMRYIMADEMAAVGVDQWDGWFGSFAKEVQDVELTAAGDYEAVNRLRGFINVPELRKLVGQYMDVVFSDDMPEMQPRKTASGKLLSDPSLTELERAELLNGRTEGANDRPYKKVVNETADPTPEQMRIFEHVQSLANEWRDMGGKARKNAMAAGLPVVPIVYEQLAARASFDARLENDEALAGKEGTVPDHPDSKVSRAIRNLLEIYRSDQRATQVVFTNTGLGTTASRAVRDASGATVKDADGVTVRRQVKVFSPIKDMVERLVQQGIPRSEIEIVDGSTSKDRRKEIADAMNAGTVRIVIGSTQSLGVGVNMQRNLRAMHHLDAPWMPGDLEQRNGRGHRQGNQWNTVMEYRYITDRIDGRRWQVLAIKQKFITDFLKADGDTRVIEGDAASDEESDIISTFAEAAGDPRVLIRQKLVAQVEQLRKRERLHSEGVADAKKTARYARDALARLRETIARIEASGAEERATKAVADHAGNKFKITVDGKEFSDRKEANEALGKFISANMRSGGDSMRVGSYGGIEFHAKWPRFYEAPVLVAVVAGEEVTTGTASVASLEASLRAYPATVEKLREQIQPALDTIQRLDEVAGQRFQRADQLKRAELQLRNLEQDISINPVPPPAWLRNGAAIDTEVRWNGTAFTVTGHRWTAAGWFVIAQDAKGGEVVIPYMDAKDAQGMPLYEEREFKAPIVHAKKDDKSKEETESQGTPTPATFAKSGDIPDAQRHVLAAWQKLARTDGLFQIKTSSAKDFTGIVMDVAPNLTITADNGDSAMVEVPPIKGAEYEKLVTKYQVARNRADAAFREAEALLERRAPEAEASIDKANELKVEVNALYQSLYQYERRRAVTFSVEDGKLAMDASQLKAGVSRGSALYAVALTYAHNNGLVFVPDPAGVSEDAMIRRTEHMLSSALKTGTTRHMLPHTAQGLDWRVGDDQHNVLELIRASADNVMDAVSDLKAVDYDWNTGQFVAADGRPVTRDDFRALADSPAARAARAGVSTLRRAVVSRSLERHAGMPAWRGVVARLLQLGRAGLRGSQLEGLMYGRGATGARGMTVEALNTIFAPALKQLAADRRLDVRVVATHADLPQSIREQQDFDSTVQAAFQGRTAYFVASAIRDRAQARRLFAHEVVGHYGIEGLLGPTLFAELKRQILSLRDRGKWPQVFAEVSQRYERNADGTFRALDDDTFAAEAIAVFAERNIQTSILQRAMAAVRAFLRRFFPDMQISQGELRQLLWEAGQRLEGRPYRPSAERVLGAGRATSMRQAVERYSFGRNDGGTDAPMSGASGAGETRAAFAKADTLTRLQELINPGDRSLLDRIKDRLQDWRPAALGALQLRHLGELAEDTLPPVAQYADVVQRMATMRNELQERGHGIVDAGMKYQGANRQESQRLFRMLHDATLAGVDPAEAHQPLRMLASDYRTNVEVTEKSVREFVRSMRGQARLNPGSASTYVNRAKEARQLLQQERKRAQSHRQMAPAFAQLSPEAKALWAQMRDAYRAQSAEYEQALISRIESLDFDRAQKAAQIARMRLQFESARVPFYVPLARWGEYWVSGTAPDGTREFYMQERASDQRRVRAELESRGYTNIGAGVKIDTARAQDGATAGFMAEMDKMLKDANAPEKVRDEAFQLYLRTLPDLSIRKNFLHRQGTPGYSQDAIRALAGHIFHGSFQIARMRYSHELDALRREAEQIARNMATMADPGANAAGAVVNELKKRHEWVLNPTDNALVNKISSVGFVYYLGLTPAAAVVNLLQTPMVALPVLAARHDAGKAARELWRAMRQSLGTYGHMERNLEGEELAAHQEFARRGVFDKTQAHNLAGVAESDTHAYSPRWHKVMTVISHVFHKAEVVNREATAMAAYRLARAAGAGHYEAIQQADRDVHESQFDYSNANRARWMQSGAAKVLLMFRQYSLAVTWLIGRAFYQAIKGADPETRNMARRKLTGILGMTALFSGTLGLPILGSVGGILNALAAAFGDDDEPWDWETELRAFLREMLGDTGAEAILRGPVQAATGLAIAQRVGMSDLWFREPDRELEGRAWANYLFEQAAGPMGGLVTNFFRGQQLMAEGHVWRGVETIMPKAIKDAMKSVRYVADGVNNLRGDPIVEDLNVFESLAQISGFSPASVANAYDYQRDIKGYEQYILDRRRALMDAFALAYRLGDTEGRDAVVAKMREFSAAYPALAITADGIRRSLMSRARYSQQADAGIIVDRRLRAGLEDRLGAS